MGCVAFGVMGCEGPRGHGVKARRKVRRGRSLVGRKEWGGTGRVGEGRRGGEKKVKAE